MAPTMTATDSTCTELLADARKVEVRLVEVNKFFICTLCKGYLRDAQKINECADTFCNGCIRMHFARSKYHDKCPVCKVELGAKPWTKLIPDPTIQGLADKLLAQDFRAKEETEERHFYARLGIKRKLHATSEGSVAMGPSRAAPTQSSQEETPTGPRRMNFEMYPQRNPDVPLFVYMHRLPRPIMCAEASVRIARLRKFVAWKLGIEDPSDVEILCRGTPVGGEYSLEFVHRTIWKDRQSRMLLEYRRKHV
ncbi:hypothetical protein Poli38472_002667 [Pythium oligandrum]|uniref:RING-type domain-containing protein n=1 Tax=Pythium oligandrum TaxID=41045 RepID=A0A8K1CHL8_PYTOL|nr:hypothetical protein Poli38472_002667 [Pythium oligandrum]|eukprot:TMW63726.1 hypothetical protein Poli38472_002667 [Pythium oligandrum]